jgi:hypothetical protein
MNTTHNTAAWYTTRFITNGLKDYLKEKGFRINESEVQHSAHLTNAVVSTRLLSREVIEIRGTLTEAVNTETQEKGDKRGSGFREIMHFVFDTLLLPISIFTSANGDERSRCLCIPDIEQYRKVLDKIQEYFAFNEMQLKIYLVNQYGAVDVLYLNPHKNNNI